MCVNGFNILDPEMLSIGTGIYLGCSVIDHSCDPNAVAVFEGITIHIRALKDMPVLDWEKVYKYLYIILTGVIRYQRFLILYLVRTG
jgi:SET and MYND domain-containing protein